LKNAARGTTEARITRRFDYNRTPLPRQNQSTMRAHGAGFALDPQRRSALVHIEDASMAGASRRSHSGRVPQPTGFR
jgi:hypothetical protein